MIDHIGIDVADYAKARRFYEKALAALGIRLVLEVSAEQSGTKPYGGFGRDGKPFFWIGENVDVLSEGIPVTPRSSSIHLAFTAPDRAGVEAFYKAALDAGATDNGQPGLRPHYHATYYGAFVIDPEGHNLEAVCHLPE